jgi:hypothetical protein
MDSVETKAHGSRCSAAEWALRVDLAAALERACRVRRHAQWTQQKLKYIPAAVIARATRHFDDIPTYGNRGAEAPAQGTAGTPVR